MKVSVPRHIFNMGIVWILTGIWHGANLSFVVWGSMYFAALVIEKYIIKPEKKKNFLFCIIYRVLVLAYINFAWVIFNTDDIMHGIRYCLSMIGIHYGNVIYDVQFVLFFREYGIFVIAATAFSMPIGSWISLKSEKVMGFVKEYIMPIIYVMGFLWAVSFLILGAHNPFIYFNF